MMTTRHVRDRHAEFCKVLRRQAVQTSLVHRCAQFEDGALWDVQPVQFIVKNVRQSPIKLPCSSNNSGSSVQDPRTEHGRKALVSEQRSLEGSRGPD